MWTKLNCRKWETVASVDVKITELKLLGLINNTQLRIFLAALFFHKRPLRVLDLVSNDENDVAEKRFPIWIIKSPILSTDVSDNQEIDFSSVGNSNDLDNKIEFSSDEQNMLNEN